jgi:hypothetical protein
MAVPTQLSQPSAMVDPCLKPVTLGRREEKSYLTAHQLESFDFKEDWSLWARRNVWIGLICSHSCLILFLSKRRQKDEFVKKNIPGKKFMLKNLKYHKWTEMMLVPCAREVMTMILHGVGGTQREGRCHVFQVPFLGFSCFRNTTRTPAGVPIGIPVNYRVPWKTAWVWVSGKRWVILPKGHFTSLEFKFMRDHWYF